MMLRSLEPHLARKLFVGIGARLRDDLAATEPAPQRLMELLAQLEGRTQTEIELEQCYAAVDCAVAELVACAS